jgi:single-strand DNA-binding protein
MPTYAHATIIGHLGRDPELRHTQDHLGNPLPVASCTLATSRKRQGEETTTWWRVSLFGKRAEVVAQHLRKGDPALFSGEPFQSQWTDRDGNQRLSLELMASDFAFVGGGGGQQQRPRPAPQVDYQAPSEAKPFDDDVPF